MLSSVDFDSLKRQNFLYHFVVSNEVDVSYQEVCSISIIRLTSSRVQQLEVVSATPTRRREH